MRVIHLDPAARDAFLADARLGVLALNRPSGAPAAVPLWCGWDGKRAVVFSEHATAKVRWIQRDPRVCLLVTNAAPEPPRWVCLEGRAAICAEHGQDEAERLTRRYLGPISPQELESALLRLHRLDLVRITLEPERIRTYAEIGWRRQAVAR